MHKFKCAKINEVLDWKVQNASEIRNSPAWSVDLR